jgi:hypothetical protein
MWTKKSRARYDRSGLRYPSDLTDGEWAILHVAGRNLGILMRPLIGAGTPREAAARELAYLFFVYTEQAVAIILAAVSWEGFAVLVVAATAGFT